MTIFSIISSNGWQPSKEESIIHYSTTLLIKFPANNTYIDITCKCQHLLKLFTCSNPFIFRVTLLIVHNLKSVRIIPAVEIKIASFEMKAQQNLINFLLIHINQLRVYIKQNLTPINDFFSFK